VATTAAGLATVAATGNLAGLATEASLLVVATTTFIDREGLLVSRISHFNDCDYNIYKEKNIFKYSFYF
jgi:hypothetical protein